MMVTLAPPPRQETPRNPRRAPRPPLPQRTVTPAQRTTTGVLLFLLIGTLGFGAFLALLSPLSNSRAQTVAHRDFRLALAEQTAPLGRPVPLGTPSAYLSAPSIGLSAIVLEGTTGGVLADGPGHRRDSVMPGQAGTSILMGRRAAYGGVFARIDELQPGAEIVAVTAQGRHVFTVERVLHDGDTAPVQPAGEQARLTLMTADSPSFLPQKAVYVQAVREGPGLPGPGPVTSVPDAEKVLGTDTSAALPLALWSQALLLVLVVMTVLRRTWGRVPVWTCGTPLLLAVLWNVYDTAARLLPNVL